MKDYYAILGLSRTASEQEIKIAYKKLSIKFHPDKNEGDTFFEDRFKEVQEAYELLSNPLKRANYDAELDPRSAREHLGKIDTEKPIVTVFEVSKKAIYEGEPITLRWQTIHANEVYIDCIGKVESEGTKTVRLPMMYDKEKIVITLTANNTFITQKTLKQLDIKNKSFKERQTQLLYDSEGNKEITKEIYKTTSFHEEEEEINALEQKTEQPPIKHPPKTKEQASELKKEKVSDSIRLKKERVLTKEERLSGISNIIEENEKGEQEPAFRFSDIYVYIVLVVLLIFITIMTIFAYSMNPI